MKKSVFLVFVLSLILYSCKDSKTVLDLILEESGYAQRDNYPKSVSGEQAIAFNNSLKPAWDIIALKINDKIDDEFRKATQKDDSEQSGSVSISNITLNRSNFISSPGLLRLSEDKIIVAAPVENKWSISFSGDVKIHDSIDWEGRLDIEIKDIQVKFGMEIDHTDPTLPVVKKVDEPFIGIKTKIKIDKGNALEDALTSAIQTVVNVFLRVKIKKIVEEIIISEDFLKLSQAKEIHASQFPLLQDSGRFDNAGFFNDLIKNIDDKIFQLNYYDNLLVEISLRDKQENTWKDIYGPTCSRVSESRQLCMRQQRDWLFPADDIALFSAVQLASQAYRFSVDESALALEALENILDGVERIVTFNGEGPIARIVAKRSSLLGRSIIHKYKEEGVYREREIDGEAWISYQGKGGVSRDQNIGVLYGLAMTWKVMKEKKPSISKKCAELIKHQIDYLIKNKWIIQDDGVEGHTSNEFPTFWMPVSIHKVAFSAVMDQIASDLELTDDDRKNYRDLKEEVKLLSNSMWLNPFLALDEQHDRYYKFNLAFLSMFIVSEFEEDRDVLDNLDKAFKMYERIVNNHQNVHFDLMRSLYHRNRGNHKPELIGSAKEALIRYIDRTHQKFPAQRPSYDDYEFIEIERVTQKEDESSHVLMSTEPLPIELRNYSGFFFWERSPFRPISENPSAWERRLDIPGLTLTHPYWFGRYFNLL